MSFDLTNAPVTFQILMDIVLAGLKWRCYLAYIYDTVMFLPAFEQTMVDLEKLIQAIGSTKLTLKT